MQSRIKTAEWSKVNMSREKLFLWKKDKIMSIEDRKGKTFLPDCPAMAKEAAAIEFGRLASFSRLWNASRSFFERAIFLSTGIAAIFFIIVLSFILWEKKLVQWNEDFGLQIKREFADDNRYEFISVPKENFEKSRTGGRDIHPVWE